VVPAPVTLPGPAKSIGTGANHSCAVLADDTVWCWGRNGTGGKYDQSTSPRGQCGMLADGGIDAITTTPRKITGLPSGPVRSVASAYEHSCALLENGAMYCWGGNSTGQLGRGKEDGGAPDELAHPVAARVLF
jgi:alpha-tubulin suppressor-like RCC1 family protein